MIWLQALALNLLVSLAQGKRLEARQTTLPAPYYFPSDQNWDGIDGTWSTYSLQVGSPAQVVRTYLSFQAYSTWVVLPEGCIYATDRSACADARGNLFYPNQSTTWQAKGTFDLYIEKNLGYYGNALYGYDTVTLAGNGESGPTVRNTTVGGMAIQTFYLGVFGVNPKAINFTSQNDPFPSLMTQLKNNRSIPSLSFGYTAGAHYRFANGVYGSLTLGGYDSSKYIANNVTFTFGADNDHEILVTLQAITTASKITSSPTPVQLLPNPIYIEIDSTLPQIWLPLEACQAFELEFGLIYNETHNLYFVNDTLHSSLLARNANITFTVGQLLTGGQTLQITLPYAAFDQVAKPDYTGLANNTNYFPLRRAANSTQYLLGRTFMQEAYIIVDYEVARFQLGQVVWDQNAGRNLVAIPPANESQSDSSWTSSTYKPTYSSASSSSGSGSSGISTGAIVGIVIAIVALLVIAILAFIFIRRRKNRKVVEMDKSSSDEKSEVNDTNVYPKAELMGSSPTAFGATHHDLDRKDLLAPPSSSGTAYSPTSSGFVSSPSGEGTMSSSQSVFPSSPLAEAHSRAIYEMPGDMPNREKDGRQLSEKEALQHRERIYNGIDEALEEQPAGDDAGQREPRRIAPEGVVNAQTGDPLGRHRAFSFEFDSSERENLTDGSGSTLVGRSPGTEDIGVASSSDGVPHREGNFI